MSKTVAEPLDWTQANVAIVGCGAAGLRAAVECAERGLAPTLISKGVIGQSHSLMAEGGVNAALATKDPLDTWQQHLDDTLQAGRHINHREMAEILCKEVPARILDLADYGAGFERDSQGLLAQVSGPSGGQSRERVVATGDFIGFVIQRALLSQVLRLGARVIDETICVSLVLDDHGEAAGVLTVRLRNSSLLFVESRSVILACGGAGQLFGQTTNPYETTGEGYLVGFEAGIELRDLEMIQFHPTALVRPPAARGILVTEAARGIGGRLYNGQGERFMSRYDPDMLELAPRDVVTRAIISEVEAGRGTENGGVLLDLTHLDPELVTQRLQNTARIVRVRQGLDMTKEAIEVAPAAHHFMGGLVPRDLETMEAAPGVFVAGEIAWGCHGANRLGGNALAETQVFGRRAGLGAHARHEQTAGRKIRASRARLADEYRRFREALGSDEAGQTGNLHEFRERLGRMMDEYVGVIRSEEGLREALRELQTLDDEFNRSSFLGDGLYMAAHVFELSKMINLAKMIAQSALHRQESRGAHFRRDFPQESTRRSNTSMPPDLPTGFEPVSVESR